MKRDRRGSRRVLHGACAPHRDWRDWVEWLAIAAVLVLLHWLKS